MYNSMLPYSSCLSTLARPWTTVRDKILAWTDDFLMWDGSSESRLPPTHDPGVVEVSGVPLQSHNRDAAPGNLRCSRQRRSHRDSIQKSRLMTGWLNRAEQPNRRGCRGTAWVSRPGLNITQLISGIGTKPENIVQIKPVFQI